MLKFGTLTALATVAIGLFLSVAGIASAQVRPDPMQGDGRVSVFYTYDRALPAQRGTLLRQEALPPELGLSAAARQVRILYTSTDGVTGHGAITVSGALFIPRGPAPAGGWPLVAWAHGTVGVADVCAPSWAGRSLRDVQYLNAWLEAGFAVVSTDYQGLGVPGPHPYLYARPAAYSVLDSIRAVIHGRYGLSGKTILVGQSQGGSAVIATAGYAPAYAPELEIKGIVATGAGYGKPLPDDKPGTGPDEVTPLLGYAPYAILAAQQSHPEIRAEDILTDRAIGLMETGRRSCIAAVESDAVTAGLTFNNALKPAGVARLQAANAAAFGYPTYALKPPLFLGTGTKDRDVSASQQIALGKEVCAAGGLVEAHLYRDLDHSGAVNASLKDSLPFARKAIAGEAITLRCVAKPQ